LKAGKIISKGSKWLVGQQTIKRATWCIKAPAYAGFGKGSHHLVYCTQSYPVITQEAVSRSWTTNNED